MGLLGGCRLYRRVVRDHFRGGAMSTHIPPGELAIVGEALYGSYWQTDLARELDVSRRTVVRWAARGAPELWRARLVELCRERRILLTGITVRLQA